MTTLVVNLFRVLRNPPQAERLIRQLTPFSRSEFVAARDAEIANLHERLRSE